MIRPQLIRSARNVRYNSTSAYVARATSVASSVSKKTVEYAQAVTYWSKVSLEIAKQVYVKEGFAPPAGADFQAVYKSLLKQGQALIKKSSEEPTLLINAIRGIDRGQVIKYGAYGIQLTGLFALGEIVGRRHVVDYSHH